MTGLEGILKKIEAEAEAAAKEKLSQANERAAQILADARAEGEQIQSSIIEQAEAETLGLLSRAEASAMLLQRKLILEARQKLIGEVIDKAKARLQGLPDYDYFEIILKMIKRYALPKSGEIIFSKTDKLRIPEKFKKSMQVSLLENGTLEVSEKDGEFEGGFVLAYGDVEVNCTLDALFSSVVDGLREELNRALFKQEG